MTWNPLDQPVDYIKLSGKRSPGLAVVAGAGSPRKWDERGGYGLSGATIYFTGLGLAKFDVKLKLYTALDWDNWHAWKSIVDKPPFGKIPAALDIWHPLLEELDIKSVVVTDVSQPEQEEPGVWVITIKFLQNRRPKFSLAKPEASKATPLDPVDQRIEALSGLRSKAESGGAVSQTDLLNALAGP